MLVCYSSTRSKSICTNTAVTGALGSGSAKKKPKYSQHPGIFGSVLSTKKAFRESLHRKKKSKKKKGES